MPPVGVSVHTRKGCCAFEKLLLKLDDTSAECGPSVSMSATACIPHVIAGCRTDALGSEESCGRELSGGTHAAGVGARSVVLEVCLADRFRHVHHERKAQQHHVCLLYLRPIVYERSCACASQQTIRRRGEEPDSQPEYSVWMPSFSSKRIGRAFAVLAHAGSGVSPSAAAASPEKIRLRCATKFV